MGIFIGGATGAGTSQIAAGDQDEQQLGEDYQKLGEEYDEMMRTSPLDDADVLELTNTVLTLDMDLVGYRLMQAAPQMFGDYDRQRGDGEFRLAVFVPLVTLFVVLGVAGSALWFAAVPPMLFFYWQGIRKREAAGDRLIDALILKVVDAPSFELVDHLADDYREHARSEQMRRENPAL